MKEMILKTGHVVMLDDEDYARLAHLTWFIGNHGYVVHTARGRTILLHRLVMNAHPSHLVDHRHANLLDNRKSELRVATRAQNAMNSKKRMSRSRFKGVTPRYKRWIAQIAPAGRTLHLGLFESEEDAALAYDKAALAHFGEFARTNAMLGLI